MSDVQLPPLDTEQFMIEERSSAHTLEGPKRLLPNPRRHKIAPDQRRRVTKACDKCHLQRKRCSGKSPCEHCTTAGSKCIYSKSDSEAAREELKHMTRQCGLLKKALLLGLPPVAANIIKEVEATPDSSPHSIARCMGNISSILTSASPGLSLQSLSIQMGPCVLPSIAELHLPPINVDRPRE